MRSTGERDRVPADSASRDFSEEAGYAPDWVHISIALSVYTR